MNQITTYSCTGDDTRHPTLAAALLHKLAIDDIKVVEYCGPEGPGPATAVATHLVKVFQVGQVTEFKLSGAQGLYSLDGKLLYGTQRTEGPR